MPEVSSLKSIYLLNARHPLLDPAAVPEALSASRADIVGNYALTFTFSDGHGTGIYTFEMLRKLCRCHDCDYHAGSETN